MKIMQTELSSQGKGEDGHSITNKNKGRIVYGI